MTESLSLDDLDRELQATIEPEAPEGGAVSKAPAQPSSEALPKWAENLTKFRRAQQNNDFHGAMTAQWADEAQKGLAGAQERLVQAQNALENPDSQLTPEGLQAGYSKAQEEHARAQRFKDAVSQHEAARLADSQSWTDPMSGASVEDLNAGGWATVKAAGGFVSGLGKAVTGLGHAMEADRTPAQKAQLESSLFGDVAQPLLKPMQSAGHELKTLVGEPVTKYGASFVVPAELEQKYPHLFSIASKMGGAGAYLTIGALAGLPGVAATAGFQSYEDTYEAAKQKGANEQDAQNAASISAAVNSGLMTLPVAAWLGKLTPEFQAPMVRYAAALAINGVTFPGVMWAQKALDNVVAKIYYDPKRSLTEGLGDIPGLAEDALVGMVLGVPGMLKPGGPDGKPLPEPKPGEQPKATDEQAQAQRVQDLQNEIKVEQEVAARFATDTSENGQAQYQASLDRLRATQEELARETAQQGEAGGGPSSNEEAGETPDQIGRRIAERLAAEEPHPESQEAHDLEWAAEKIIPDTERALKDFFDENGYNWDLTPEDVRDIAREAVRDPSLPIEDLYDNHFAAKGAHEIAQRFRPELGAASPRVGAQAERPAGDTGGARASSQEAPGARDTGAGGGVAGQASGGERPLGERAPAERGAERGEQPDQREQLEQQQQRVEQLSGWLRGRLREQTDPALRPDWASELLKQGATVEEANAVLQKGLEEGWLSNDNEDGIVRRGDDLLPALPMEREARLFRQALRQPKPMWKIADELGVSKERLAEHIEDAVQTGDLRREGSQGAVRRVSEDEKQAAYDRGRDDARDYVTYLGQETGREFGAVVLPDGRLKPNKPSEDDTESTLRVDEETAPDLYYGAPRSVDGHHNHPRSSSFSRDDFVQAAPNNRPAQRRTYVHGHDGSEYWAYIKTDSHTIGRAYDVAAGATSAISSPDIGKYRAHLIASMMQEAGLIDYHADIKREGAEERIAALRERLGPNEEDETGAWARTVKTLRRLGEKADVSDRPTRPVRPAERVAGTPEEPGAPRPESARGETGAERSAELAREGGEKDAGIEREEREEEETVWNDELAHEISVLPSMEAEWRRIGEKQPSGFYFLAARKLLQAPSQLFPQGGQAVINWLRKSGVSRAEINHFQLQEKFGDKATQGGVSSEPVPVTRGEMAHAIAERMFDFRLKHSRLNPERPPRAFPPDYPVNTRAQFGPRIPGQGIYDEKLMALPKKLEGGERFAPGYFVSPHWKEQFRHTWQSLRGTLREVPGWGRSYVNEETQTDAQQGATTGLRPRISPEDYLERIDKNPAYMKVSRRFNELQKKMNEVLDNVEDDATAMKKAGQYADKIAALQAEHPEFFGEEAKRFLIPEKSFTPETPFDENFVRNLARSNLLHAVQLDADAVMIPTSETTKRIQLNTFGDASHFYDTQLKPSLQAELRRIEQEMGGAGQITLEKVALPKAFGGPKREKPYTVWAAKLSPEMKAHIREGGLPMFARIPEGSGSKRVNDRLARIANGKRASFSRDADSLLEEIARGPKILPESASETVISAIEPRTLGSGAKGYRFTMRDGAGEEIMFDLPADKVGPLGEVAGLTLRVDGRLTVVHFPFQFMSHPVKGVFGTRAHENIHALRQSGLLPGSRFDDSSPWGRLLSHASDRLGVMQLTRKEYWALQNDPREANASDRTLHQIYRDFYGEPQGNTPLEKIHNHEQSLEMMDQEAVAHMIQLYADGAYSDRDVAPVKEMLDAILSGETARGQAGGPSPDPGTMASILGQSQRRALDNLGFYSKALEAAQALSQAKGTPEQMLAQLKKAGVKDAEIKSTGLDKFLEGKKSVTQDDITKHLEENRVQVRESVYGDQRLGLGQRIWDRIDRATGDRASEVMMRAPEWAQAAIGRPMELLNRLQPESGKEAKWKRYSIDPSNPTYRETVLHLPPGEDVSPEEVARAKEWIRDKTGKDPEEEWAYGNDSDYVILARDRFGMPTTAETSFLGSHYPEPNTVVFTGTSLQKDAAGKTVGLLDRFQSDWGQKLRDKGQRDEKKIAELKKRHSAAVEEQKKARGPALQALRDADNLGFDFLQQAESAVRTHSDWRDRWEVTDAEAAAIQPYINASEHARLLYAELQTAEAATPGHPLVNTTDQWVQTGLRRTIRQFVEAGADKIAISPAQALMERGEGGHDAASTAGMKKFYEEILPKALGKILSKMDPSIKMQTEPLKSSLDGRTFEHRLPHGLSSDVHMPDFFTPEEIENIKKKGKGPFQFPTFPLTEKVKQAVMEEGQPLFARMELHPGVDQSIKSNISPFESDLLNPDKYAEVHANSNTDRSDIERRIQERYERNRDQQAQARRADFQLIQGGAEGRPPASKASAVSRPKISSEEQSSISKAIEDAINIVGRIAGKDVKVVFRPTIGVGNELKPSVQAQAKAFGTETPKTVAGFYRPATVRADALIGLATNDPQYSLRTAAGHEAWHHVETALATPSELKLLNSPREMERLRARAAEEVGLEPNDPRLRALDPEEVRALAFQNYLMERDAGMAPLSTHSAIRKFWDKIINIFQAVRKALGGRRYEDIFESARTGEMANRGPIPAQQQRTQEAYQSMLGRAKEGETFDTTQQAEPAPLTMASALGRPATFQTAKGSTYQIHEDGTTTRNKAARPEHPGDFGPQPRSARTVYVTKAAADALGEFQVQGGPKKQLAVSRDGKKIGVRYTEGKDAGKVEKRTVVPFETEPKVGLFPVEMWDNGNRVHFGNAITSVGGIADLAAKRATAADERLSDAIARVSDELGIMAPATRASDRATVPPRQRAIAVANNIGPKLFDLLGPGFRIAAEAYHVDELRGYVPRSTNPVADGLPMFIRDYIAWPDVAKRRAPELFKAVGDWIDGRNPRLLKAIEQIQENSRWVDRVGGNTPPAAAGGGAEPPPPPDVPSAAGGGSGAGPGRFGAMFRSYAERFHLGDIVRDLQMKATPMAVNNATEASRAVAKGFANALRLSQWEWQRADESLKSRFTAGQRERMWIAADEESVARQQGRDTTGIGLDRLDPAERAEVERLQRWAQDTWEQARAVGIVDRDALPSYVPRMLIRAAEGGGTGEGGVRSLGRIGNNLRTTTAQLRHRKHLTAAETEAAGKSLLGDYVELARDIRTLPLAIAKLQQAIAGRTLVNRIKEMGRDSFEPTVVEGGAPVHTDHKWFTIDHPALKTFRPKLRENEETGKWEAVKDENGDTVMEKVPLYIRDDFEGPLRAVLSRDTGRIYNALMELKGKTMSVIMFSPLIHNAVEFGRAFPMLPGKMITLRVYFEGNRAKNDPEIMRKAIEDGLVPIGHRGAMQDITSMMEEPHIPPGRSWTAKLLGAVPGLFSRTAGDAVKRYIDRNGDIWHNTLLWDRIGDLQMGLYVNMRDKFIEKGVDVDTASKTAAHFANRYAGALPHEAMSTAARQIANLLMFSRSFTLGNIGAMKDVFVGLPKEVQAQINREVGPEGLSAIKSVAKRKALAILLIDMGLLYAMNSLLQNVSDNLRGDKTWGEIGQDYINRFYALTHRLYEHPFEALNPFKSLERLSATSTNEPGKQDRILIGYEKDGTAIYARNPFGKIGEEFIGYLTSPFDMVRRKLSTMARPAYQIMANDKGFNRRLYDPYAETPADWAKNIGRIVWAIAEQQVPIDAIKAIIDIHKGREAHSELNKLKIIGPLAGVTFSKGAPGGPAAGVLYRSDERYHFRLNEALPDIRQKIQDGDEAGARAKMTELGVPRGLQDYYVRTTRDPRLRLKGRKAQDFKKRAEPEELDQYLDALRRSAARP